MDAYAGTHQIRIGTKNDDSEPLSNLRKILLYKGSAVHSNAAGSIDALLQSKESSS